MSEPKKPFGFESFQLIHGRWRLKRKKKPSRFTCAAVYCHNDPYPGHRWCTKCKSRIWRANNPVKYHFWNLKHRAKQRGHAFMLTMEQWMDFVKRTGLIELHGRFANNLSIDRIEDGKGYTADNIQTLTVSENARKRFAPVTY